MVRRRNAPSRTMSSWPILRDARKSALLRMRLAGAAYLPPTNIPTPIASTLNNIAAVDSQPSQ
ncbi:hypothetical protein SAMN05444050_4149 [Afipia sp. GAS231]|nr:hypothetical protein SAMN05444050_4149 [Afipia sp. GAS231]